jgi:hypothetical protein
VSLGPLAAEIMRIRQSIPIEHVLRLPIDLTGFCDGLRATATALYPADPELGEVLRREARHFDYLRANRACIEVDNPQLPPDVPAEEFVKWSISVWRETSPLAHAVARADQLLGRTRLLACFQPAERRHSKGASGRG